MCIRDRNREVERVVSAGAAVCVDLAYRFSQLSPCGIVVERARDKPKALGKLGPDTFAPLRPRTRLRRLIHDLEKVLTRLLAGKTDDGESGRQQAAVSQVVDRRDELAARQLSLIHIS